ncbi:MAG: Mth938-like domain-containing protein [Casimicrobiaceae bacterium]
MSSTFVPEEIAVAMQFVREAAPAHAILAFDDASIRIGEVVFTSSIALSYHSGATPWNASDPLDATALAHAVTLNAEIIIIGTGRRQRFPPPVALRPIIEARLGFEIMDTRAACRTYNVLLSEGRRVGALLVIGDA